MARARRGQAGDASLIMIVLVVVVTVMVISVRPSAAGRALAGCPALPVTAGSGFGGTGQTGAIPLGTARLANARVIYDEGVRLGLPARAEIIAIATAARESRLLNLPYGDRDSLGLFQQRPSKGWGTPDEVMRPGYAADAFYSRLVRVPGWPGLPVTVAAQDVQRSQFPDAYAPWEPLATALVATFSGDPSLCGR